MGRYYGYFGLKDFSHEHLSWWHDHRWVRSGRREDSVSDYAPKKNSSNFYRKCCCFFDCRLLASIMIYPYRYWCRSTGDQLLSLINGYTPSASTMLMVKHLN